MTALIVKAFNDLGYSPRENQVAVVQEILNALNSSKRHVFLNAPTGSGKSLIALVVQKVTAMSAVIVTATNALGEQYKRDYPHVPLVIGANNYPCKLRQKLGNLTANAELCYKKSRFFYTRFGDEADLPECKHSSCDFALTRSQKHTEPVCVTNYSYYIIDQLYIKEVSHDQEFKSELCFFDEAHLINEQFSQHYAIFYSATRGEEFLYDVRSLIGHDTRLEAAYEGVFNIINENIDRGSIGMVNHMRFVDILERFYKKMMEIIDTKKIYAQEELSYDKLCAMHAKYHGLFCKIDDYHKYGYEVVVDVKKSDRSLSVVPIFVGKTSEVLLRPKNIFMSATLNFDFMVKTLDLDIKECAFIKVPYAFNLDDKMLNFQYAKRRVNYSNMNDDATIADLQLDISEIMANHQNQNGIIITTSFLLAKRLADQLISSHHDVMIHTNDIPAKDIISSFKSSTQPTVLISPSLFEGVDLPGELSRFQILVKAPYLSLGSKRMYYISRKHRGIYLQLAIMRMNQAFGRSTRDRGDVSVTYSLDTNCQRLFKSKFNDHKDQFTIV